MREIILQTYIVSLPILLGYIVWLLKNQKKYRDANGLGTKMKEEIDELHIRKKSSGGEN